MTWWLWYRGPFLYYEPNPPRWSHGVRVVASGSIMAVLAARRLLESA